MITFEEVNKHYGQFHVLKDINLHIQKGEVVVIIGPSGSGKSTMLRCINRLESIDAGKVLVNQVSVQHPKTNINLVRQNIGMVFQHFHLYPHKTVLENIMLAPMKVKKVSKEEAKETAEFYLNKVGIPEKADTYPSRRPMICVRAIHSPYVAYPLRISFEFIPAAEQPVSARISVIRKKT